MRSKATKRIISPPTEAVRWITCDGSGVTLFTIGHSNRSVESFVELLIEAKVGFVADIRKIPMSKANPQFNEDRLPTSLEAFDVGYEHIAALGGLRGKAKGRHPSHNSYWTNTSFRNYVDYASSETFCNGLETCSIWEICGPRR
jgi:uncharacterized protein (DUF488 family)